MQEINAMSKDEVKALFEGNEIKAKTIESLSFETESTPLNGRLGVPVKREFKTTDEAGKEVVNKYMAFPVYDSEEKLVGYLSCNRLFDQAATKEIRVLGADYSKAEYVQRGGKAENHKKIMLKTVKINDLSKYGNSGLAQIGALVGKTYNAAKVPCDVIKNFKEVVLTDTAANRTKIVNNTIAKDLVKFEDFE